MTGKIIRRATTSIAVATLAIAWACSGLAQEPGAGRRAGEKVDDALQGLKGGLNKAGDAVKDRYAKARNSAHNLGVEGRIYSRLHWDKALNNGKVELTGQAPGVFTLTGQVDNLAAKQRAVELAETTVGVTQVIDQLSIRPATETTTTTTTTTTEGARPARPVRP